MNLFSSIKTDFLRKICLFLSVIFLPLFVVGCQKQTDYFSCVSELRNNILTAEGDGLFVRVYATDKEYPYAMDGVAREHSPRVEIHLSAPSGDKECELRFDFNGKTYGGDMSFDNVKAEYYYSVGLDVSTAKTLDLHIRYGENEYTLAAKSVLTEDTLAPKTALEHLIKAEKKFFDGLTDKYGFAGEIYLRLLCEDTPYYYVGVIDKSGKCTAFLLSGKTGKVLAKRKG